VSVVLVVGVAVAWFGQAIWLSRVMNGRGFHPLPWFMILLLVGPAVWPLALIEALSGPPAPEMLRRGKRGPGALDIFVLFEDDHIPDRIEAELQRLMSRCRRLVLARVIKAGGPAAIEADAARFLKGIVSPPGARDAELQLHFGDARRVITGIEARGDVDVLLRSSQASRQFYSDGGNQEERRTHDVPAA
jgi:hypothetical protein